MKDYSFLDITICDNMVLRMNSATVKNITEPGTYVGVPSKKITNITNNDI